MELNQKWHTLRKHLRNKSLLQVDFSLLVLGGFYILVMAVYVFLEVVAINDRPVLIDGHLEVSYPSSTTMLVMCVIPTAMMQLHHRIGNQTIRKGLVGRSWCIYRVYGRWQIALRRSLVDRHCGRGIIECRTGDAVLFCKRSIPPK